MAGHVIKELDAKNVKTGCLRDLAFELRLFWTQIIIYLRIVYLKFEDHLLHLSHAGICLALAHMFTLKFSTSLLQLVHRIIS